MDNLETVADLFEILGRNAVDLIGQPETGWLDFKRDPYHLDDEHQRAELAKDVSAMANAGQGVIVLGVQTEQDSALQVEVASQLRPSGQGIVDSKRIQDTIHGWVYPRLDIHVRSHSVSYEEGQLWTILVERQKESDLPFIVAREFAGRGANRNLFGIYQRHSCDNRPYSPPQVHQWLHHGRFGSVGGESVEHAHDDQEPEDILQDDLRSLGLQEGTPSYFLQAKPVSDVTVPRFYPGIGPNSIADVLRDIPALRPSGFNLPEGEAERTRWNGLRVIRSQRESISISRTGIATTILGETYLTWAGEQFAGQNQIWISPLALVEYTLEFWRLYRSQILERIGTTDSTAWRAGMRSLNGPRRVYLPRRMLSERVLTRNASPSISDDFELPWTVTDEVDPGRLAFAVLKEIYAKFGLGEDCIPCAEGDSVSDVAIWSVDSQ